MTKEPENRRTINILFVPGGGMLGLIPAMILSHLEDLTETPASDLFQVIDGVSTGSIIAAGININNKDDSRNPKFASEDISNMFRSFGSEYFPNIRFRKGKMVTSEIVNVMEDAADPLKAETDIFDELEQSFTEIEKRLEPEQEKLFSQLKKLTTKKWLTRHDKKRAGKLCDELGQSSKDIEEYTGQISELIFLRAHTNLLSRIFRQSAIGVAKATKKAWANNYLFDSKVPEEHLKKTFGETRLSDCLTSTYISAYDIRNRERRTFFCRKKDFFNKDPNAEYVTSEGNQPLWDVVMASVANPFAFAPHVTEDGSVYNDKAPFHTPEFTVADVMKHKPDDAEVKLIILGTGRHLSKQAKETLDLREKYARYGMLGNLMRGREIEELQNYAMSSARSSIRNLIGDDNIIELSPRLSPRNSKEIEITPTKDILDASEDNIRRINAKARQFICEEDEQIRDLAKYLIQNLYNVGNIDEEKYNRIMEKIDGNKSVPNGSCDRSSETLWQKACRFFAGKPTEEQDNNPPAPKRNGTDDLNPPAP